MELAMEAIKDEYMREREREDKARERAYLKLLRKRHPEMPRRVKEL